MNDTQQITTLLHLYAERIDSGDGAGVGALFTHASVDFGPGSETSHGADAMAGFYRSLIRIHSDGTPRTRHVVTNAIIDVDDGGLTANSRSYYTVVQQTETLPLQVIAAGRYHDRFEKADGQWRFAHRTYLMDFTGNVSEHMNAPA